MARQKICTKFSPKDYKEALDNSHDGFMVSDAQGQVLYANDAYCTMTALSRDILETKTMGEIIKDGHMEKSSALMAAEEKKMVSVSHFYPEWGSIVTVSVPVFNDAGEVVKVVTNVRDTAEMLLIKNEFDNAESIIKQYRGSFRESQVDKGNNIICVSSKMKDVFKIADKVCKVDVTVLILGESGVGKEVVARYIHEHSQRREGPFVAVNCGAIPPNLLESELFGYVGGAFTGASKGGKEGYFEAACGGTIFLDEIGEISPDFQVKLLRALETKSIVRVGDKTPIDVDVRILAATNKDIEFMVEEGEFREDLFYRLNVIKIEIPALRDRPEDIVPLSLYYLDYFNKMYNTNKRMSLPVLNVLKKRSWRGNIRELKNLIERLVVLSAGNEFQTADLPFDSDKNKDDKTADDNIIVFDIVPLTEAVESVEKQLLEKAQKEFSNTREMAKALKIDQSTVTRKLKRYGLS